MPLAVPPPSAEPLHLSCPPLPQEAARAASLHLEPCPASLRPREHRDCIPRDLPVPRWQIQVQLWAAGTAPRARRVCQHLPGHCLQREAFPWRGIQGKLSGCPAWIRSGPPLGLLSQPQGCPLVTAHRGSSGAEPLCLVPPAAGWVQPGWGWFGIALVCILKPARRSTKSTPGAVQDTCQRLDFCCSSQKQFAGGAAASEASMASGMGEQWTCGPAYPRATGIFQNRPQKKKKDN